MHGRCMVSLASHVVAGRVAHINLGAVAQGRQWGPYVFYGFPQFHLSSCFRSVFYGTHTRAHVHTRGEGASGAGSNGGGVGCGIGGEAASGASAIRGEAGASGAALGARRHQRRGGIGGGIRGEATSGAASGSRQHLGHSAATTTTAVAAAAAAARMSL